MQPRFRTIASGLKEQRRYNGYGNAINVLVCRVQGGLSSQNEEPAAHNPALRPEISGRNWHARTPKVTQLNSLFFALCLPKIYSLRRCTFEEATDSESQKISSDLLIVCWRKRGFIVFAGRANIGHFYLRRRAGL